MARRPGGAVGVLARPRGPTTMTVSSTLKSTRAAPKSCRYSESTSRGASANGEIWGGRRGGGRCARGWGRGSVRVRGAEAMSRVGVAAGGATSLLKRGSSGGHPSCRAATHHHPGPAPGTPAHPIPPPHPSPTHQLLPLTRTTRLVLASNAARSAAALGAASSSPASACSSDRARD